MCRTREPVYRLVLWRSLSGVGGYAQSIEILTLVKLVQIISKLAGGDWDNELELKKILLQILLWHLALPPVSIPFSRKRLSEL